MKYDQFEQVLEQDLAWRKKEIADLLFLAKSSEKEVLFKSVILLLYAHWEGFIKKSSKLYIKYVSEERLKVGELSNSFRAVALKEFIKRCLETKDKMTLANEIAFVNSYSKLDVKKFKIDVAMDDDFDSTIIDTESNLKLKVFKNIIGILGLNYKRALEAREHYINSHLLANRNAIGHGSKFDESKQIDFSLSLKDIEKLKTIIFSVIDNFRDELLEYIYNKYYLVANEEKRLEFETKQEVELEKLFASIEASFSQ
jgi:hypothetical protein